LLCLAKNLRLITPFLETCFFESSFHEFCHSFIIYLLLLVVFVDEIGGDESEGGGSEHGSCLWT
jgi:hypothetical protein